MPVNFTKRNWLNGPGGGTPIDAANLNRLEAAIEDLATSALDEATADATYAPQDAYVIFRDTAGNPLPPGSVTEIRINTSTNEIDDIIFTPAEG